MEPSIALDIGRDALVTVLVVSGPLLLVGLVVGLLVGVFQAVTQIHEMTLTFIPKILSMIAVFIFLMPWMLLKIVDYTVHLFNMIPTVIR